MINPDKKQVFETSDYFYQLGTAFAEFIQNNKFNLTDEERNELFDKQIELLQIAGKINMIGVSLIFEDVAHFLSELNEITSAVKKTIKKASAIHDVINLATVTADIGTSIIVKDAQLIIKNTLKLKTVLQSFKEKKI